MALFDHKNLVSMVGVVTTPRNMPALLVLELCDHGTLLGYVSDAEHVLDNSLLLTFCHDVGSGMHYLSSRRIIHRDVSCLCVLFPLLWTHMHVGARIGPFVQWRPFFDVFLLFVVFCAFRSVFLVV